LERTVSGPRYRFPLQFPNLPDLSTSECLLLPHDAVLLTRILLLIPLKSPSLHHSMDTSSQGPLATLLRSTLSSAHSCIVRVNHPHRNGPQIPTPTDRPTVHSAGRRRLLPIVVTVDELDISLFTRLGLKLHHSAAFP
jgi:hypothetical protein